MNERGVGVRGHWRDGAGRAAALLACAGALWLVGCGEDADDRALTDASIKLASLSAGAGAPIPDATAEQGFKEVISALQGLTGAGDANAADASLMVSSAQRGLGLRAAGRAVDLQRQLLTSLPGIRAQLEAWKQHNASAQAAASYDPAPEFARIDKDVRARQDDAEAARAERARIDKEISDLIAGVTSRMAQASELRTQAGSLQLQIAKVSATEGQALTEQIRDLSRRADAFEMQARDLKAQADHLNVELHAAEVSISKLESQIGLFAQSRASVQTRQSAAQARAAQARADAQLAAGLIATLVDTASGSVPPLLADAVTANQAQFEGSTSELFGDAPAALTPFVEQAFAAAIEDAAGQLDTAARTARGAQTLRRSGAQIATGEAQQSLGDVRWTQAAGLDAYAQILEELASARPSLPSAPEYATRAAAARERSTEAKRAAFQAYQDAKSAYEASGAKAEVATKIEELGRKLNDISRIVGAGAMDADAINNLQDPEPDLPDDEPAAEEPADDTPTAAADPAGEIKAAIAAVVTSAESGDYEPVIGFMHAAGPDDEQFVESIGVLLRAVAALDAATADAFGESFSVWLEGNPDPMLGQLSSLGNPGADLDPDALDIRVQGDEAIALTGNPMAPEVRFTRIDGQWKQVISVADLTGGNPMAAAGLEIIPKLGAVYRELAVEVEGGNLGANAEVATAFKAKLVSLMQMPGGG